MADVKDETAVTPMGDLIKGRTTGVPRILVIICAAIPIFLTLFHLYAGAFTGIDMQLQKVVFVTTILVGTFLLKPLGRKQCQ